MSKPRINAEARAALERLADAWRDRGESGHRLAALDLRSLLLRMESAPEGEVKDDGTYRSGRVSFSPEAWHGLGFCRYEGCTCEAGEEIP